MKSYFLPFVFLLFFSCGNEKNTASQQEEIKVDPTTNPIETSTNPELSVPTKKVITKQNPVELIAIKADEVKDFSKKLISSFCNCMKVKDKERCTSQENLLLDHFSKTYDAASMETLKTVYTNGKKCD